MFRTKFKLKNLKQSIDLIQWTRGCSGQNDSLNHQFSIRKKGEQTVKKLKDEFQNPISSSNQLKSTNFEQISNERQFESNICEFVRECNDLASLLDLIRPYLKSLNAVDLQCVFNRIIDFAFKIKLKKVDYHYTPYQNFVNTLQQSPEFSALLNRTVELIEELNAICLVRAFKMFDLIKVKSSEKVFKLVLDKLIYKAENDLSLEDLYDLLKALSFYRRDNSSRVDYGIEALENKIFQSVLSKILNNQIDKNNVALLQKYFQIFLNIHTDFEAINHLIKFLLLPENAFNFKVAVHLLKSMKQALQCIDKNEVESSTVSELKFDELVHKCNKAICEELSHQATNENVFYYCVNLHNYRDENLFFENFYDPQILSLISPLLVSNLETHPQDRFLIYRTMLNFSKFTIYDEMLLNFFNNFINRKPHFITKIGVANLFNLYSQLQLPFINYQQFAQLLFNQSLQFERNVLQATTGLTLLCRLVMCDVQIGERMFARFDRLITENMKSRNSLNVFVEDHLNLAKIAKMYLSMFSKMKLEQKSVIEQGLDRYIVKLSKVIPVMNSGRYFKVDTRLSKDAWLWEGKLFVNQIAIYDKSIDNLIDLEKYKEYFNRIEQIPLTEDQQVLFIIKKRRLRGNINKHYEFTQNHSLKRIVRQFNIKPVDIFFDDLKGLDLEDETNFVIKELLASCR